jgi:outer membrane protein assembly factor BamA
VLDNKKFIIIYFIFAWFGSLVSNGQQKFCIILNDSGVADKGICFSDSLEWVERLQAKTIKDRQKGFLLAGVDSVESNRSIIAYYHKGELFYWNNPALDSNSLYLLNRAGLMRYFPRTEPINPARFNVLKIKALDYCLNNGYPFANIYFDSLVSSANKLSGQFVVNQGKYIRFGKIQVQGEAKIPVNYLERYTGIRNGYPYAQQKVTNLSKRIEELPFLTEISPAEWYIDNNEAVPYLFLKKKAANRFSGIVGFTSDSKTKSKLVLTGELQLQLVNSLGKGENLQLEWRKLQETSQELNTQFTFPFIAQTPLGLNASFSLYKQDSTYLYINPLIGVVYHIEGKNYLKVFFEKQQSNILLSHYTGDDLADYTYNSYGLEWYSAQYDYIYNPLKGYSILIKAGNGNRKVKNNKTLESEKTVQQKATANANLYVPLVGKLTMKLGVNAGYMSGKDHLANELFLLGGINSLRGTEEKLLMASAYSIQTLEFRFLYEKNSAFFVFLDQAYYTRESTKNTYHDSPAGVGAGMLFETKSGIFSLQYALGKQAGNSFVLREGKVHIGYISRF